MHTIRIDELIKQAAFGPVTIGMTEKEVIQLLGPPSGKLNLTGGVKGFHYGWWEFFFFDGKLTMFQNDHLKPNNQGCINFENQHWRLDPWILQEGEGVVLEEMVRSLRENEIDFKVYEDLLNLPGQVIRIELLEL